MYFNFNFEFIVFKDFFSEIPRSKYPQEITTNYRKQNRMHTFLVPRTVTITCELSERHRCVIRAEMIVQLLYKQYINC